MFMCKLIGGAGGNGGNAVRMGAVSAKQTGVCSGAEKRGSVMKCCHPKRALTSVIS